MSELVPEGKKQFIFAPYELDDGRKIDLIQPEVLPLLPVGTVLTSVNGRTVILGRDNIDDDTRGGMLPYGLPSRAEDRLAYVAEVPEDDTSPYIIHEIL